MTLHHSPISFHLFGAGGHAAEVAAEYERAAGTACHFTHYVEPGYDATDASSWIAKPAHPPCVPVTLAIGNPTARRRISGWLGWNWATYGSDLAHISKNADLGIGVYVAPLAYIGPHVHLFDHVLVNHGAHVSHDCIVGRWCHVAIGAMLSGGVQVGEETEIGAGAVILPRVKVGARCIIGAGAVVSHDVPDETILRGEPARISRRNE